jgi:hypothetical protein
MMRAIIFAKICCFISRCVLHYVTGASEGAYMRTECLDNILVGWDEIKGKWRELCMVFGFHGSYYEECRLLGYKTPVRTSQETHYVSTSESNRLMLCKIWGFHCSDYEKCLLGHRNPVRTSQETHYVSTTETSQLMLCKIWSFQGSDYE